MSSTRPRSIATVVALSLIAALLALTTAAPAGAAVLAEQSFDDLTADTFTTDSLPDGSTLTNAGASNSGGPGLDFTTVWLDSRGVGAGPVTPTDDSSDFIGVNDFAGTNAPDVAADGTPVATGVEQNFEFNDGDGRLEARFESVDVSGATGRAVSLDYWIASTGYEADDAFEVVVDDGSSSESLLSFGEPELEANASADDGSANWSRAVLCLDAAIGAGLGTTLDLVIAVDTNSSAENVFVDRIAFETDVPSGDCTNVVPPEPTALSIPEIQGAGHRSPVEGELVETTGVVTARAFNGLYVQDPVGDGDADTADGIFVFTGGFPGFAEVGDEVHIEGTVSEFVPGGTATANLSTTQLSGFVTVLGPGALPDPVIIGRGGRVPPNEIVISENELPVNLLDPAEAAANPFNPEVDGIDFYESLEGMRVKVQRPQAVSAIRQFNSFSSEFFTVPDQGRAADPGTVYTRAGGIRLDSGPDNTGDQNPERVQVQIDGTIYPGASLPDVQVGDRLADVVGVVGYSFGNFEVNATEVVEVAQPTSDLDDTTRLGRNAGKLTVASYNVLNLSPDASDDAQRASIAQQIVDTMRTPDVIALQEIQDDSGEIDDGTVDATVGLAALVAAIEAAGGPTYTAVDVAPVDGSTGGAPGGNIRNAFLYQADRVSLEDLVYVDTPVLEAIGSPDAAAFEGTRRPLAGTFRFDGRDVVVVNNHFSSRFGSTPVFGATQPFVQAGEVERGAQSRAVNDYVDALVADGLPRAVVVGDLNTFEFTDELSEMLPGTGADRILYNMTEKVRRGERYSFIFDGNSQALDHAYVTEALRPAAQADYVHTNVDFPRLLGDGTGSDHDPVLLEVVVR